MPAPSRSLVAPTSNPLLERALLEKLARRNETGGGLGWLEPLAVRLGLVQDTLKPRFSAPKLLVFAADHGLAVDGIAGPQPRHTHELVSQLLTNQLPLAAFARSTGLALSVVDCGVAFDLPAHERLLVRKIAHGSRNARLSHAMTVDQARAAMRAGMEIGDSLDGNAVAFAGLGIGGFETAALVLSRLADCPVRDLLVAGPDMDPEGLAHVLAVAQGVQNRHREVSDPVEVLAAFGGFEIAVMAGAMLMAASKRQLLLVDGLSACAALMIAARIAQAVTDYCVFCRSHGHRGLDQGLALFQASALLELGLETMDGTGAALSWPLITAAAALLSEVADGEEPGPPKPQDLDAAGA